MATAGATRGAGPERAFAPVLPDRGPVVLDRDETHHLVRVRRAGVGEEVVLFDGEGGSRAGRLVGVDREGARVEVTGPAPDREPRRRVVVATAWPEGARADDLVATLAELGVTAVVPLRTARVADDPADRVARRRDRYDRLVRGAAKVNGRSRVLRVETPASLEAFLAAPRAARLAVLDTDPALPALAAVAAGASDVAVLVGPEGGFLPEEVEAARRAGAVAASLGACALRTETAAVAAAAVLLGG